VRLLTSADGLQVGDVVMTTWHLKDKTTGRPFTWRWFGVVMRVARSYTIEVWRLGAPKGAEEELTIRLRDGRITAYYLPEAEWPDGVWALRTKLILEGRIDIT
jgi:hypothetical protein